ncbi:MAG TPA: hypothetical protein VFV31_10280 [Chitinophagaceae bacterium]|nr:hypothetical protein [Chitinophagaceae bacterium]
MTHLKKWVLTPAFGIVLFTAVFTFTSCKKDDCPAPTYPIEGLWIGKYGNGTATPASGYSMVVEPGGKLTVADGDNITTSTKAYGTWTLSGNTFQATYTYPPSTTYSIKATWSNSGKLTDGTWGPGSTPTGSGTWFMDRKN